MGKKALEAPDLNAHYAEHSIDTVDVAQSWNLDPFLFSALKYIQRRGRKKNGSVNSDMAKAVWYIVYYATRQKWLANRMAEMLLEHARIEDEDNV